MSCYDCVVTARAAFSMETIHNTDFEFVEPNLFRVRFRGILDVEEFGAVFERVALHIEGQNYMLVEVEWEEIKSVTPEARRLAADWLQRLPDHAIAIVGGDFTQRAIARLVLTATSMLNGGRTKSGFFKESAAARTWLLGCTPKASASRS